ncbi:phosphatase 2C-like domain-containing protein [Lipomyces chichibuensis]|uniref:phosphatase 2C-like domain-containing protein n=1 Tax=Lipomyces chichibuensis TaxID=1546026 RepID=UPI003343A25F
MPAPTRFSLLVAAYPTITAALLFAFRRLQYQYPILDRIITHQSQARLFQHNAAPGLAITAPTTNAATQYSAQISQSATGASGASIATNNFQYTISPSYHAKDRNLVARKYSGSVVANSGKRSTRPASGEDSFFFSKIRESESVALGVIDGVGGWNEIGVDATDFSHSLAEAMAELTAKLSTDTSAKRDESNSIVSKFSFPPLVLLDAGYNSIRNSGKVKAGGSTACVGVAHGNGTLQAANLGDSGFFIFRDGKIHYMSIPQTHYFNAPYQLAIIPQKIIEQNARYGGKNFDDKPSDANLSTHKLKHGDVVLFCTDGVLDNLLPSDCLRIVNEEMISQGNWIVDRRSGDIQASGERQYSGVDSLAKRLVSAAFKASIDPKTDGPFAIEAQRQMKVLYKGGKPDDITALVMFVHQHIGGKTQEKS